MPLFGAASITYANDADWDQRSKCLFHTLKGEDLRSYFPHFVKIAQVNIIIIIILNNRWLIIIIPYSHKYWRELNLVIEPKITIIARILADLNLAVRYRIAIRIICELEILADFNLVVVI